MASIEPIHIEACPDNCGLPARFLVRDNKGDKDGHYCMRHAIRRVQYLQGLEDRSTIRPGRTNGTIIANHLFPHEYEVKQK